MYNHAGYAIQRFSMDGWVYVTQVGVLQGEHIYVIADTPSVF